MLLYSMIITGLQEKRYFYDNKKANMAIAFVETFCRHHEGELAPQLIKLELWQKALTALIFGIVDSKGRRQFVEICCILGRKNGKTLLCAAWSSYALVLGDYGARV